MRLRFIWVGKTKDNRVRELVLDYLERLRRFARVEVTELRDRGAGGDPAAIIEKEGEDILRRAGSDQLLVALDERGREFDSRGFARLIARHQVSGTRQMTFVIGGPGGLSDSVKKRAALKLALSRMTLTHEMTRAVLMEQVYRAFTIIKDLPYQK